MTCLQYAESGKTGAAVYRAPISLKSLVLVMDQQVALSTIHALTNLPLEQLKHNKKNAHTKINSKGLSHTPRALLHMNTHRLIIADTRLLTIIL